MNNLEFDAKTAPEQWLLEQLSEAQAQIAMKDEVLLTIQSYIDPLSIEWGIAENSISATSETIAAWRAKETEPLLSKIAELETNERAYEQIIGPCTYQEVADERNKLRREVATLRDTLVILDKYIPVGSTIKVLEDTQATALAYEQEVEQRGAVKALENLLEQAVEVDTPDGIELHVPKVVIYAHIVKLRANKGEVK